MTVEVEMDWESVKMRWGRHRSLNQGRGWVGVDVDHGEIMIEDAADACDA